MSTTISNFDPEQKSDVDLFAKSGQKLSFSHEKNMLKHKLNDTTVVPMRGILHKYHGALRKYIIDYELSDGELAKYRYQPKLLCREIYGTPELWADILFINNMTCASEFTKKKIKLYSTLIIDAVSEILMLYDKDMETNRKECEIKEDNSNG